MARLQLSFSDVYTKVSEFVGTGTSPGTTPLAKAKDIVYRGYMRFLAPIDLSTGKLHTWSFLRQEGLINTIADKWEYELPANFAFPAHDFKFDSRKRAPIARSEGQIMEMRSSSTSSSYPQYYALRAGKYHKETGQKYEVIFQPPPDGVYKFHYSYVMEPEKPTETDDVFVGGAVVSECILQCALAVAEHYEDEELGVQNAMADKMVAQLVALDKKLAPDTVGMNLDVQVNLNDPAVARELRWVGTCLGAYGQT